MISPLEGRTGIRYSVKSGGGLIGVAIGVALAVGACAPGGGPAPSADPSAPRSTFAFRAPEAPLTYTVDDAVTVTYEGGSMPGSRVESSYYATLRLRMAAEEGGLRISAGVVDFSGELRSPSTGITRVNEGDVSGEYLLQLDHDGDIDVLEKPEVTAAFSDVVGSDDLFRDFFLRLPDRPIARGATWTDTIRIDEDRPAGRESSTIVVSSTWESDTTFAGRTLRVVHSTREIDQLITSGSFEQHLSGTTRAVTLWDPVRGRQVRETEEGRLEGTLVPDTPGADIIPLSVRVRREISLGRS